MNRNEIIRMEKVTRKMKNFKRSLDKKGKGGYIEIQLFQYLKEMRRGILFKD